MMTPERLVEILEACEQGEVQPRYSGRGMYGASCPGIVTDNLVLLGAAMMKCVMDEDTSKWSEMDQLLEVLLHTRWDDMGKSMIIYWPRLTWAK
jgi:hypothetical protein